MKNTTKVLSAIFFAVIAFSLFAVSLEQPVWTENFQSDNAKWKLNSNARIITEGSAKVLELTSLSSADPAQADFGMIPVKPSTWYELSYSVHGVILVCL